MVVILASQVLFNSWRTISGCFNHGASSPNAKCDGAAFKIHRTAGGIKRLLHSIYRTELLPATPYTSLKFKDVLQCVLARTLLPLF